MTVQLDQPEVPMMELYPAALLNLIFDQEILPNAVGPESALLEIQIETGLNFPPVFRNHDGG